MGKNSSQENRRGFMLKGLFWSTWAGLAAAAGLGLGAVMRMAGGGPSRPAGAPVGFDKSELPEKGQAAAKGPVALLRDDKGLYALSLICPHLGCHPVWNPETRRFACPCHGSDFAPDGSRIAGPAPRGLDHLHLAGSEGGGVLVMPGQKADPGYRIAPGKGV